MIAGSACCRDDGTEEVGGKRQSLKCSVFPGMSLGTSVRLGTSVLVVAMSEKCLKCPNFY